jgi:hypothetical protein
VAENRPDNIFSNFVTSEYLYSFLAKKLRVLVSCFEVECIKVAIKALFYGGFAKWPNFFAGYFGRRVKKSGNSECGAQTTAGARSDIFGLENLSVRKIPVFRYSLLMRIRGYIEFEPSEKQCWNLWNIKTAVNYMFTKVSHIICPSIFPI